MSTKGRVRMQEKQEASLRTNIVFGVLNLCALIVVGILLVMVLRRPFLQIESVTFIGNTMIAEYELRRVTDPLLEEKWLGLVPRTSLLFVPKRRMRTLLPDRISRIEEIRIERNGLRHIVISLREYAPAYLWCTYTETESTTMRTSEICWYVARDGYVFARAPLFF
ncbi:MAG: hypothetical protein LRY46_03710 [Candidatus Pacebacteria bacterium]|nr:hypothetical protein [Candidatus Paceibacterota bacterium]